LRHDETARQSTGDNPALSGQLTQRRDTRRSHGWRDPERRGGTVAFDVPHGYEVSETLLANDILVDYRPNAGIRVAPHFYTSDEELRRVVTMIDDILATGDWRAHSARPAGSV
jgi:selenocysteine lyase/cysteine desulfurase